MCITNRILVFILLLIGVIFACSAMPNSLDANNAGQHSYSCMEVISPVDFIRQLKQNVISNNLNNIACLFQLHVVTIEFDKKTWQGGIKYLENNYQSLNNSGFNEFIKKLDNSDIKIEPDNNDIILKKRLIIEYRKSDDGKYLISQIRDSIFPNNYFDQGIHSEVAFKKWYAKLRKYVGGGDKSKIAQMMCYPLHVDFVKKGGSSKTRIIKNKEQFIDNYDNIITTHTKDIVGKVGWQSLFAASPGILVGQGDIVINPYLSTQCVSHINNGPGMEVLDREGQYDVSP